jgi:GLPGLI family protein
MKTNFIITFVFSLFALSANAQTFFPVQIDSAGKYTISLSAFSDAELLDKTVLRCQYKQSTVRDTLSKVKWEEVMLLEIGNRISKYAPLKYSAYYSPELSKEAKASIDSTSKIQGAPKNIVRAVKSTAIFKNYPDGGLTNIANTFEQYYIYQEPLQVPSWVLLDDTLTVNGYFCKKAKTHFRGWDYTAWYAPEIPVSDGPWKFSGLPGLIFKVEESNGYFSYECISVEKEDQSKSIYIDRYKVIPATKAEFDKAYLAFIQNPRSLMGNMKVGIPKPNADGSRPGVNGAKVELEKEIDVGNLYQHFPLLELAEN